MALNAGRWPDRLISVGSLIFYSVPGFWIGLMLVVLFSVKLGWLPSGGADSGPGWDSGHSCPTALHEPANPLEVREYEKPRLTLRW